MNSRAINQQFRSDYENPPEKKEGIVDHLTGKQPSLIESEKKEPEKKETELADPSPNVKIKDAPEKVESSAVDKVGSAADLVSFITKKGKEASDLPVPKGGIALILVLILFIIFAITPVDKTTKETRLTLMFKTLLNQTKLKDTAPDPSSQAPYTDASGIYHQHNYFDTLVENFDHLTGLKL